MADQSRTSQNTLAIAEALKALEQAPWRFDFYAAVHLFETLNPDKPPLGRAKLPRQDVVRLGHEPRLNFASSTVAKLEPDQIMPRSTLRAKRAGLMHPLRGGETSTMPIAMGCYLSSGSHHIGRAPN